MFRGLGFRVLGFRGLGFRVQGFGFCVLGWVNLFLSALPGAWVLDVSETRYPGMLNSREKVAFSHMQDRQSWRLHQIIMVESSDKAWELEPCRYFRIVHEHLEAIVINEALRQREHEVSKDRLWGSGRQRPSPGFSGGLGLAEP